MTKYTFILIYKITQSCLKWIAIAIVDMTTTIDAIVNFPQKGQHSVTNSSFQLFCRKSRIKSSLQALSRLKSLLCYYILSNFG